MQKLAPHGGSRATGRRVAVARGRILLPHMAASKSARRSRKRRASGRAPRAVPAERRRPAPKTTPVAAEQRRSGASTYGERPPGVFGGVPVSEVAILAGLVAVVVGWLQGVPGILFTGVGVCLLGVLEVTAREHFSGYRSHSTLLAGMVAVAVETAVALLAAARTRVVLVIVVIPVFAGVFALLRRRFTAARQARVRAIPRA